MEALRSRWVRLPVYFVIGFGVAALLARLFHPHYLPLCNRINAQPGVDCRPIPLQAMVGLFVFGLGIFTMVVVPIISALYQLVKHGHDWEMARGTETAITNLPILAGLLYLATGAAIAISGY